MKAEKIQPLASEVKRKFAEEKEAGLKDRFKNREFEKWYIYSPKFFSKSTNEEQLFVSRLGTLGIKAISFSTVLTEIRDKLDYMGYDAT